MNECQSVCQSVSGQSTKKRRSKEIERERGGSGGRETTNKFEERKKHTKKLCTRGISRQSAAAGITTAGNVEKGRDSFFNDKGWREGNVLSKE
jgi:hypothetical protein